MPRVAYLSVGVVTAAAVAVTVGVTAAGADATTGASGGAAALAALWRGIVVGVPLAVALYACSRPAAAVVRQPPLVSEQHADRQLHDPRCTLDAGRA